MRSLLCSRPAVAAYICTVVVMMIGLDVWLIDRPGGSATLSMAQHVAVQSMRLLKDTPESPPLAPLVGPPHQHLPDIRVSQLEPEAGPIAGINVLFGLIGRDVAGELPYVLRNIESLGAHMASFAVALVENDSGDDTKLVFDNWAQDCWTRFEGRCGGELLDLGQFPASGRQKKSLRLLAHARNRYLELLLQPEYKHIDYLIAVDSDMCVTWDVSKMVPVINNLLPFSGTHWHVLYAYGACGWYLPQKRPGNLTAATMAAFKASMVEMSPYTPGALPVYCDMFAFKGTHGGEHNYDDMMIWIPPGTCDMSAMAPESAADLECSHLGGEAVIPVQAAFGGWGMYRADILRTRGSDGQQACKYKSFGGTCEHTPLSLCLQQELNATQLLATGLVVEWEGCDAQERDRWQTLNWKQPPWVSRRLLGMRTPLGRDWNLGGRKMSLRPVPDR